jgi:membrane associated rhomboid family serine protease
MQNQVYLPRLTLVNKILIIAVSALFVLGFILRSTMGFEISSLLGLSASQVNHGFIHTFLTYPLANQSLLEVILNSLMLWLMGSEFEENWGRSRYLKFLFTVIVGGGLIYYLISMLFFSGHIVYGFPLTGLSGVVASLCVAYAVIYPTRVFSFMMVIPIQAKYFCWILVVIALYQGVSSPLMIGSWGQLGSILCGFLFMVIISNRNFKALSDKITSMTQLSGKKKSKAKLSIVREDNDKPPKYWQ